MSETIGLPFEEIWIKVRNEPYKRALSLVGHEYFIRGKSFIMNDEDKQELV